jgi:MscS family membrane protein
MVFEILTNVYFGNPLLAWVYFFATIIIFVLVAKTILYFSKGFGRRITAKIKGEFDDILIDLLEEPIVFLVLILGLFIGYQFLSFSQEINFYFLNVIKLLVLAAITWLIIRIIDVVLEKVLHPIIGKTQTKFDDQIIHVLSKTLKVVIVIMAIIIALDSFGIDVFTLVAGVGIGGLAIAFAAKETISDVFGGISILLSRPFILGDSIDSNGVIGTVEEISLRHTKIRNLDKRLVIIPNAKIAGGIITNITSAPKRKTVWKLGVTYNTSVKKIEEAKKIITKAINSCKLCENDPKVAFDEFADSSLNILVVFFTKTGKWADMVKARDEVGLQIKKDFEKAKIDFAFPTQTIYLEK